MQYMMARVIKSQVPGSEIFGASLPYWGINSPERDIPHMAFTMEVRSHVFPLGHFVHTLNDVADGEIVLRCLSARMAYYQNHRDLFMSEFLSGENVGIGGYGADKLVVSIRLGELLTGSFPFYAPLPISWYEDLVRETGLKPVFYGQIGDDVYSQALRRRFPNADFVVSNGAVRDFHILRSSVNVALSVSTFAWLAAWLSGTAENVFMPIYMMFNPDGRPDIDLLPVLDTRYRFYKFADARWGSSRQELTDLCTRPSEARQIDAAAVKALFPGTGTDGTRLQGKPTVLSPSVG